MAKISNYTAATTPAGGDITVLVQGGVTKKVSLTTLATYFGTLIKNNFAGTTAPGTGDDSSDGYAIGSVWVNTTANPKEAYRCVDASAGNAVWLNTTLEIGEVTPLLNAKADKVATSPSPEGYLAKFDASGNLVTSDKLSSAVHSNANDHAPGSDNQDLSGKADKVVTSPSPDGYVAEFDATGNLVKSDKLSSEIGGSIYEVTVDATHAANAVAAHTEFWDDSGDPPDEGDTITIGTKTYTFMTALTPAEGEVLIGSDNMEALTNFSLAINRTDPGTNDGLKYKCAAANADVEAVKAGGVTWIQIFLYARTAGVQETPTAISYVCTSSAAYGCDDETLLGGVDGFPGAENDLATDGFGLWRCMATNTVSGANWTRVAPRHYIATDDTRTQTNPPTTDVSLGYAPGSLWITFNPYSQGEVHLCTRIGTNFLQWKRITQDMEYDGSLILADGDSSGSKVAHESLYGATGVAFAAGEVVYKTGTSVTVDKARANSSTTMPALYMVYQSSAANGIINLLREGFISNSSWSWTPGDLLYVSADTAGAITDTPPATPTNIIQIIGVAVSATCIDFRPQLYTTVVT
jgi:hypothetical protein